MGRVSYGSRVTADDELYHEMFATSRRRQVVRPPCSSLEELARAIKEDISAAAASLVPECTTVELSLAPDALLPLHRPNIGPYANGGDHDLPPEFKSQWTHPNSSLPPGTPSTKHAHPQATVSAIIAPEDTRVRQIVQRAASRGIVAAVEAIDGFKYSFNNAWAAKDEDGQRFSYICQDSMQNKDRHANGFTRTQKHLKGEGERGVRKPTYDCKGSISVKCSLNRGCMDVYYRHYAIHPKVAERKSLPRPARQARFVDGSPVNGVMHSPERRVEAGGLVGRLQAEESAYASPPPPVSYVQPVHPASSREEFKIDRPLKRKYGSDAPVSNHHHQTNGTPLSLADLLRRSESAGSPPPAASPSVSRINTSTQPPPVPYELPSWQRSPPSLNRHLPQEQPPPAQYPAPYPVPYQRGHSSATYRHPPPQPQQQPSGPSITYASQQRPAPAPANSPPAQQPGHSPTSEISYPRNHGLFTTLKPVPQDSNSFQSEFQISGRSRPSCLNCRHGKRKCDEQRPMCGNCLRGGRYDCIYEPYPYLATTKAWHTAPPVVDTPSAGPSSIAAATAAAAVSRIESPDPWFPKR